MAWAYGSSSTGGNSSGTSLVGVSRPASIANGDWIILLMYLETTGLTLSFSNGTWTKVRSDIQPGGTPDFEAHVYRSQYAGEGATFDITWGGTNTWRTVNMSRYTGGDAGSTLDPADTDGTGHLSAASQTTVDFDGYTPNNDNCLVFYGCANLNGRTNGNLSGTTPTLTERSEFSNVIHGDGVQTTATAIGNRTSTLSLADWNIGQLFALTVTTPGGGGGPTPVEPLRQRTLTGAGV